MVLKNTFTALVFTTLLALGGPAFADENRADEYRADEFLDLDLSKALLSPKLLGPPSEFAPVAVEAKAPDRGVKTARILVKRVTHPKVRVAHLPKPRRHVVAQAKPARHHRNPLNAQAFDTRIQTWPCKSGGICNWKR